MGNGRREEGLWDLWGVGNKERENHMEYYSAIRNNEFMKFLDKWMELENIILNDVTQFQKNTHGMHSLISRY